MSRQRFIELCERAARGDPTARNILREWAADQYLQVLIAPDCPSDVRAEAFDSLRALGEMKRA